MWINNSIAKPLRKGYYKTLVDWDGYGNLQEVKNQYFKETDWSYFESSRQFICYWWAEKEDYKIISDRLDKEMENYERSNNTK